MISNNPEYEDAQALLEMAEDQSVLYESVFHVQPNTDWQGTGVVVKAGQEVRISAQGTWLYCNISRCGDEIGRPSGPEGNCVPETNMHYANAPDNALIGQVGSGQPFFVGNETKLIADSDGEIFLSNSGVTLYACFGSHGTLVEEGGLEANIRVLEPIQYPP